MRSEDFEVDILIRLTIDVLTSSRKLDLFLIQYLGYRDLYLSEPGQRSKSHECDVVSFFAVYVCTAPEPSVSEPDTSFSARERLLRTQVRNLLVYRDYCHVTYLVMYASPSKG